MKKFLALMLVLVMAFSFAACGNDENVKENDEETVSNKTENKNEISNDKNNEAENDESAEENTEAEENITADDENTNSEKADESDDVVSSDTSIENTDNGSSGSSSENNSGKTLGNKLLDEFKTVAGSGSALSVAEKLSAYPELSVLPMGAMAIEPGYLAGFDNAEITGFKEGATFAPMMGTIPFVGYVFTLEDGADVNSFISMLTSNANMRWNICTEAEETVTGSSGKKVFFVMCNKSLEE